MAKKRLLVTGGSGFVGQHVATACQGGVFEGWDFHQSPTGLDIRSAEILSAWVASVRPDAVLHLAAQSFVPRSFENPRETLEINVLGTLNLLQALKASDFKGRMVYVSSGDVYGRVPDDQLPVTDARVPEPRSPYAVSKIAAEQLCLQWLRTEALDVMIARPFNHVGPGQDERFVLPSLASQVVAVAENRQAPQILAGDIDSTRDFTDVRDVVAAYAAMINRGVTGSTYLIASGQERRVRDLLLLMSDIAGVSVDIQQDAARMRPAEQRRMVADSGTLRRDTGWSPIIPIQSTLQDILDQARSST